jgi:hypothetical protein
MIRWAAVSRWIPPKETPPARAFALLRRGVHHGFVLEAGRPAPKERDEIVQRWADARPVHLPGALAEPVAELRAETRATVALFERMRRGEEFQDEVWSRVDPDSDFQPAGVAIDLGDEREVEKVFADAVRGGRRVGSDLWAKLSWIAHDERDESLRIRFSFGAEALMEWMEDPRRSVWADRFARAVFPECAAIADNGPLVDLIDTLVGRRCRYSERIIYSNSPGGGAIFHHDAETHQLGVVYGQLAGETAWLAITKRELAAEVAAAARGRVLKRTASTPADALAALNEEDAPELARMLNETPGFTRRLVERGDVIRMRAGDALLLPSHGPDDVAWHSVFALGKKPSLAHSYGIFAARRRSGG